MNSDITDGYGNWWDKCSIPNCDLHIVRPGYASCHSEQCPHLLTSYSKDQGNFYNE